MDRERGDEPPNFDPDLLTHERHDMPKTSEMIQSKFLRKEDFDEDTVATIKGCSLEEVGNTGETRWVLHFAELPKGLVLNATTIRVLEAAYGNDSDDWNGKRIKIYVDPNITFQGRVVGGLRIRTPRGAKPEPRQPKPSAAGPADDFSDDIPF